MSIEVVAALFGDFQEFLVVFEDLVGNVELLFVVVLADKVHQVALFLFEVL